MLAKAVAFGTAMPLVLQMKQSPEQLLPRDQGAEAYPAHVGMFRLRSIQLLQVAPDAMLASSRSSHVRERQVGKGKAFKITWDPKIRSKA